MARLDRPSRATGTGAWVPWMAGSGGRPWRDFWQGVSLRSMSYDLAVFDPSAPPPNHAGFLAWYQEQTKWGEGHRYDDPKVATPALRGWFLEIIQAYPMLNGPFASKNLDDPKITDYS